MLSTSHLINKIDNNTLHTIEINQDIASGDALLSAQESEGLGDRLSIRTGHGVGYYDTFYAEKTNKIISIKIISPDWINPVTQQKDFPVGGIELNIWNATQKKLESSHKISMNNSQKEIKIIENKTSYKSLLSFNANLELMKTYCFEAVLISENYVLMHNGKLIFILDINKKTFEQIYALSSDMSANSDAITMMTHEKNLFVFVTKNKKIMMASFAENTQQLAWMNNTGRFKNYQFAFNQIESIVGVAYISATHPLLCIATQATISQRYGKDQVKDKLYYIYPFDTTDSNDSMVEGCFKFNEKFNYRNCPYFSMMKGSHQLSIWRHLSGPNLIAELPLTIIRGRCQIIGQLLLVNEYNDMHDPSSDCFKIYKFDNEYSRIDLKAVLSPFSSPHYMILASKEVLHSKDNRLCITSLYDLTLNQHNHSAYDLNNLLNALKNNHSVTALSITTEDIAEQSIDILKELMQVRPEIQYTFSPKIKRILELKISYEEVVMQNNNLSKQNQQLALLIRKTANEFASLSQSHEQVTRENYLLKKLLLEHGLFMNSNELPMSPVARQDISNNSLEQCGIFANQMRQSVNTTASSQHVSLLKK